jgi:FkbM family methyltransferase
MVPIENHQLRFYSQHGEDYLLWEFFKNKASGYYLDIGAFDGRYLSNTYSFYDAGWRGICVDANPENFKRCAELRAEEMVVHSVCCNTDGENVDFLCEPSGLYSSKDLGQEKKDDVFSRLEKNSLPNELTQIKVPTTTLNSLLSKNLPPNTTIDFISIDVEGAEMEVLNGFDIDKWQPTVIIVEANDEQSKELIIAKLALHAFALGRILGVNLIFVQGRENLLLIRNINIKCAIEKVLHPKGKDYTYPQYLSGHIIDSEKDQRLIKTLEIKKALHKENIRFRARNNQLQRTINRLNTENK